MIYIYIRIRTKYVLVYTSYFVRSSYYYILFVRVRLFYEVLVRCTYYIKKYAYIFILRVRLKRIKIKKLNITLIIINIFYFSK